MIISGEARERITVEIIGGSKRRLVVPREIILQGELQKRRKSATDDNDPTRIAVLRRGSLPFWADQESYADVGRKYGQREKAGN